MTDITMKRLKAGVELFQAITNNEHVSIHIACGLTSVILSGISPENWNDFFLLINPLLKRIYGVQGTFNTTTHMVQYNLISDNTQFTPVLTKDIWLAQLGTHSQLSQEAANLFENWATLHPV